MEVKPGAGYATVRASGIRGSVSTLGEKETPCRSDHEIFPGQSGQWSTQGVTMPFLVLCARE